MKGISVILTIVLLVLATQLANHLRNSGKLPANASQRNGSLSQSSFAKAKVTEASRPIRL